MSNRSDDKLAPNNRPQVNRFLIGLITLGCFGGAIAIAVADSLENIWCASLIRVGLLMGAFWLAAPTKGRAAAWANLSPWWIIGSAGLLMFVVRRPRVLIPFLIALIVLGVLVPKLMGPHKRPRR